MNALLKMIINNKGCNIFMIDDESFVVVRGDNAISTIDSSMHTDGFFISIDEDEECPGMSIVWADIDLRVNKQNKTIRVITPEFDERYQKVVFRTGTLIDVLEDITTIQEDSILDDDASESDESTGRNLFDQLGDIVRIRLPDLF